VIEIIGNSLASTMGLVGLPGEFGFVWATTMIANIYGGLLVFFQLSLTNSYTVAQVTILGAMMLIAHTLPVEARIAQKAGVRLWFTLTLRILGAFIFGFVLNIIFTFFNLFKKNCVVIWKPENFEPTITNLLLNEIRYYFLIFLIIFGLVILMRILKKTGAIDKLNKLLEPVLEFIGLSKNAVPVTIIGMTLGLAYGGGLIIQESKSKLVNKKNVFLSLSLMGLTHSVIEDTILIFSIGASIFVILFGRIFFTIIVIVILIKFINHISLKTFEKYFVK
ncbi:MAG: nucleoside recognition domain-containing protein, partial [Thermoplasmatota archaeon]